MSNHIERLIENNLIIGDADAVHYLKELRNQKIEVAILLKETIDAYKSTLDKRYLNIISEIETLFSSINTRIKEHLNLYYIVNEGYGLN